MLAKTAENAEKHLTNDLWSMQQKFDGKRIMVSIKNNKTTCYNRKGDVTDIHDYITEELTSSLKGEWFLDGELVEGNYVIFDVLTAEGIKISELPFVQRASFLNQLREKWHPEKITLAKTVFSTEEKETMFRKCQENLTEGVMFRYNNAPYIWGKRTPRILKCKFTKTVDVVVMELNRDNKQLSMGIGLWDHGVLKEVSGCKLKEWAVGTLEVGDVVEVKYLYATNSNRIYQPVLQCKRDDKLSLECTMDQLIKTKKGVVV